MSLSPGQVLFLELRKIEKLDEENVFEVNWLMGLLREMMESMFIWVSKNKEINATTEENMSLQTDEAKQVSDFPPFCFFFWVHAERVIAPLQLICNSLS